MVTSVGRGRRIVMEARLLLGIACVIFCSAVQCTPLHPRRGLIGETVFDVTKYGAKPDGRTDNAIEFIQAWSAACNSNGAAKVLIPRGQFVAGEVIFAGPCTAKKPIILEIQGNVLAYSDISAYSNGAWMMIEKVDGVVVTGGGTINGRGREVWMYGKRKDGPPLPVLLATNIVFQDIVMNKVRNPIVIDQHYDSKRKREQSKVKLSDVHFRNIRGTTVSQVPISLNCSSAFPCEGVELANINLMPFGPIGPLKSSCSSARFFLRGKLNPAGPAACL
ncbi:Galacturan 1,4-alpha-galacturonidase [Handroanthus impetiginosus]|uniref:Galacturan 1,4-alpha-galacturonidase n=1 Tax=Handroanthus impetiginosus TaxID=429701 RepID=A0A2G9GU80_9LAMI|nr:Galacturan 1,4-alpha-galacturonidase [Handroanthus impetiginosus]